VLLVAWPFRPSWFFFGWSLFPLCGGGCRAA
jgi:hypothetical protein